MNRIDTVTKYRSFHYRLCIDIQIWRLFINFVFLNIYLQCYGIIDFVTIKFSVFWMWRGCAQNFDVKRSRWTDRTFRLLWILIFRVSRFLEQPNTRMHSYICACAAIDINMAVYRARIFFRRISTRSRWYTRMHKVRECTI